MRQAVWREERETDIQTYRHTETDTKRENQRQTETDRPYARRGTDRQAGRQTARQTARNCETVEQNSQAHKQTRGHAHRKMNKQFYSCIKMPPLGGCQANGFARLPGLPDRFKYRSQLHVPTPSLPVGRFEAEKTWSSYPY